VQVQFADGRVFDTGWGDALLRDESEVIYLAVQLRNAGAGVAHLVGYRLESEPGHRAARAPRGVARHRRGDAVTSLGRTTIDLLYGDIEDGLPTITRFVLLPSEQNKWRCDVSHHWRHVDDKYPGWLDAPGGSKAR
jgi:hypothetical protein